MFHLHLVFTSCNLFVSTQITVAFQVMQQKKTGQFVGVSENLDNDMTFSILDWDTNKVISRHIVRPTGEPSSSNIRIDPLTKHAVVASHQPPSNCLNDNEEAPDITDYEPHKKECCVGGHVKGKDISESKD